MPASTPLNRKYRPQSFDSSELVGQEHIVRTLKNAVRMNRIASAYLFCGPRGTGKTSTARILAKAVNCLDPEPDNRPCNQCSSCVAINTGATPDVIEIDAASNRGIDDIRDLRERVNYAPTQLKTKFYIIDEAHQITGAAANAFLKTLEEPPEHTKFILATTDPEELLPTIVSRCQRFDFRRHTAEGIAKRVRALAEREGIRLTDDALALVAELAHGSMRDPIGLLDQLSNYQPANGDDLTADDVRELVGITRSEIAVQVLAAISERDAKTALQTINEAVNAGQDPRQLNRQIVSLIRDGLYLASGAAPAEADPKFRAACEQLGLEGLLRVAGAFADTDSDIRSSVIPQLPLELAVLEAILEPTPSTAKSDFAERPATSVREPARSPRRQEPSPSKGAETPPEPAAPSTRLQDMVRRSEPSIAGTRSGGHNTSDGAVEYVVASNNGSTESVPGAITIEALADLWPKIRADIKSLDRRTEALLLEVDPVGVEADEVILGAAYEFHRDKLNEDERRAIVESVIGRRIGRAVRIQCVLRSEYSIRPAAAEATMSQAVPEPIPVPNEPSRDTDEESADEKMLGAVVRMFNGEIIED